MTVQNDELEDGYIEEDLDEPEDSEELLDTDDLLDEEKLFDSDLAMDNIENEEDLSEEDK